MTACVYFANKTCPDTANDARCAVCCLLLLISNNQRIKLNVIAAKLPT